MSDRFEDVRGVIQDLLTDVDAVTHITTLEGAVRGNHVHYDTTQWTFILSGALVMASGAVTAVMRSGEMVKHGPGMPHAWKALEDSECLVFTRGPRSGENYESDTYRHDEPLLIP
jgi:quercetin dioxygenase-like cupin family protein